MKNLRLSEKATMEKVAIHCTEELQDAIIRELAHDKGYEWGGEETFNESSYGSTYGAEYCIPLTHGKLANVEYYEDIGYIVIPFQDAVEVLLHGQVLEAGDKVYHIKIQRLLTIENIEIMHNGVHLDFTEEGLSTHIGLKASMEYYLAWQSPYELTDEWKKKPEKKRDFTKYVHGEDAPKWATHWAIDSNGMGYWYDGVPEQGDDTWLYNVEDECQLTGYRHQLLRENGIVSDWKDSLVSREEWEEKC